MSFYEFLFSGGLLMFGLIGVGCFAAQSVFTFLLWRKGDETYFLKFLSFCIATVGMLIGTIAWVIILSGGGSEGFLLFSMAIFFLTAAVAAGIQIFVFIRDSWVRKEVKA